MCLRLTPSLGASALSDQNISTPKYMLWFPWWPFICTVSCHNRESVGGRRDVNESAQVSIHPVEPYAKLRSSWEILLDLVQQDCFIEESGVDSIQVPGKFAVIVRSENEV